MKTVNDYSPPNTYPGLMDDIDETNDRVSAFLFGSNAYPPIITHTDIGIGYQLLLPSAANFFEGTNFSNALSKAISLINSFLYEHVCFVMITDGQAAYPSAKVTEMVNLFNTLKLKRCKVCAKCYFIRGR